MEANAQNNGVPVQDTVTVSQVNKNSTGNVFLPIQQVSIIEEKKLPRYKIDSLKQDDAYWYANLEPAKKKKQEQSRGRSLFDEGWFTGLLWIIIVVSFIAVVIWYLVASNIQLFRKASKKISSEEEIEISENIFLLNYDREIGKAVEAKNYRLAVRLWYLRTLKELLERSLINYSHEKTNSEYLNTLSGGKYYRDFFRLTRNFEYTWYGGFPLSEEGYNLMQKDFTDFKNSLP